MLTTDLHGLHLLLACAFGVAFTYVFARHATGWFLRQPKERGEPAGSTTSGLAVKLTVALGLYFAASPTAFADSSLAASVMGDMGACPFGAFHVYAMLVAATTVHAARLVSYAVGRARVGRRLGSERRRSLVASAARRWAVAVEGQPDARGAE